MTLHQTEPNAPSDVRVVFLGTPDFAVPSLRALNKAFDVVGALTTPDAVRSRGKKLIETPVALAARELDIPLIKCAKIDAQVLNAVEALHPHILCVCAFGLLLPEKLLRIAPWPTLNVHGSLLPRWRGAAPFQRAILAQDERIGISIMEVVKALDAGPYCLQASIAWNYQSYTQVSEQLARIGAECLVKAITSITAGKAKWIPQDEQQVTYAHKIEKGELLLDPHLSAQKNLLNILASNDSAPARLCIGKKNCRVSMAAPVAVDVQQKLSVQEEAPAGHMLVSDKCVYLGCSDGYIEITKIQPEGKQEMSAAQWACGVREKQIRWTHI